MSHVTGIFTELWRDNAIDVPQRKLWGGRVPRGIYAPAHEHNNVDSVSASCVNISKERLLVCVAFIDTDDNTASEIFAN